jgi:hypothetical protein
MQPGKLDLPTVWRGRTYPQIILTWLDQDGQPIDLTDWTPRATSKQIDFHPVVLDAASGITSISLTKTETSHLKLGVENWDWIWDNNGDGTPPLLAGSVQIKEPVTQH